MAKNPRPDFSTRDLQISSRLVHAGSYRSRFNETSEALFLTGGYVFDSAEQAAARIKGDEPGFVYSRYSNPTVAMFEERMAELEGAESARATASGMAAVTASLFGLLKAGDHLVAGRALFGTCRNIIEDLLPRYGITATLVDGTDLEAWAAAVKPETKVFFLESPTNPTLEIIDIAGVAAVAKAANAKLVVDNVFATPLLQNPLQLGADCVVYSATKHIDGQGRCLAGVVLGSEQIIEEIHAYIRPTGPSISPFNAWVMLKGMETLELRVERQSANASRIADALAVHPSVSRVLYPFRDDHPQSALAKRQMKSGGTVLTLEILGGQRAAFQVSNNLKLIRNSNNLGDTKSLITHPATTLFQRFTEEQRLGMGITQGMLRFSAGIEDADDLLRDFWQALDGISVIPSAAE